MQHRLVATKTEVTQTGPNKKVLPGLISVFFFDIQFFFQQKVTRPKGFPRPQKLVLSWRILRRFCDTPPRTNMTMEKEPFEDVSPIEDGVFHCHLSFRDVIPAPGTWKTNSRSGVHS